MAGNQPCADLLRLMAGEKRILKEKDGPIYPQSLDACIKMGTMSGLLPDQAVPGMASIIAWIHSDPSHLDGLDVLSDRSLMAIRTDSVASILMRSAMDGGGVISHSDPQEHDPPIRSFGQIIKMDLDDSISPSLVSWQKDRCDGA